MSGGSLVILGSPSTSFAELRKGPQAVLRPRLRHVSLEALQLLPGGLPGRHRGDLVHIDAGVPEVEVRHLGKAPHGLPVRTRRGPIDRPPLLGLEASISAGHGEAGHQPLHVPFEWAWERLVEVVDAEHQSPVGRGEDTEVGQMRIAAELCSQPRPGRSGQVGRHQVGRSAEEGERRYKHPAVADRHQLGHPGGVLLRQQLDRIGPIRGRLPVGVPRA